jgi:hypothetical protein
LLGQSLKANFDAVTKDLPLTVETLDKTGERFRTQ